MSLPTVRALLGSIDDLPDDLDFEEEDGCVYLRAPIGLSEDDRWLTLIDVGFTPRRDSTPLPDLRSFDYHEFGYEITILDQSGKVPIRSTIEPGHRKGLAAPKLLRTGFGCRKPLLSQAFAGA